MPENEANKAATEELPAEERTAETAKTADAALMQPKGENTAEGTVEIIAEAPAETAKKTADAEPGEQQSGFSRLVKIVVAHFTSADVVSSSAVIAFYLLLALFPLLIALGNLLPLLNITPDLVIFYLDIIIPAPVLDLLRPLIDSLLDTPSSGLLSIGAIGALWSTTKGISFLQKGMNKAYGIPDSNYISRRIISLITILIIMLFFVAFILFFSIGELVLGALSPTFPPLENFMWVLKSLKWPVTVPFIFCLLIIVYRATPDIKVRLRETLPGAAFATVGLLVLAQGFTLYLRFSAQQFNSYGAMATFFIMMFWLNFTFIIIILGAVLNASIAEFRFGEVGASPGKMDMAIEERAHGMLLRFKERRKTRKEKKAEKQKNAQEKQKSVKSGK